jgi:hypothetical protein
MRRVLLFMLMCASLTVASCRKAGPASTPAALQKAKSADPTTAPFVAGKRNKVFHRRHCPYAAELDSPVGFETLRDAEASGKIPCAFCKPHMIEAAPPADEKPAPQK